MVCAAITMAQTGDTVKPAKKKCSCSFSSINQAGWLKGKRGPYLQLQTINGLRFKTWFAGIGAGIDYYTYRGYPVFADVRKNIFNKLYTPFVYADAGIHFADVNNEKSEFNEVVFNNGFYYDVGGGYNARIGKIGVLLISAGFSYKYVTRRESYKFCSVYCYENSYTYTYHLNRFSVKMGWQF